MAGQKVTQLTTLTLAASGDLLYIIDDATGTPISKAISISDLFGGIPVDTLVEKNANETTIFQVKNDDTGEFANTQSRLENDAGVAGIALFGSNYSPISAYANKLVLNSSSTVDGIIINVQDSSSLLSIMNAGNEVMSVSSTSVSVPSGLVGGYKTIADLGTNGTTADADSARELDINAGAYTASTTLTVSNVTNLQRFSMQITNTNANVLTFAGITVYFKTEDLPTGVTFASNALTFPADSAVKYNLVGLKFDGSTFDCKIEIR